VQKGLAMLGVDLVPFHGEMGAILGRRLAGEWIEICNGDDSTCTLVSLTNVRDPRRDGITVCSPKMLMRVKPVLGIWAAAQILFRTTRSTVTHVIWSGFPMVDRMMGVAASSAQSLIYSILSGDYARYNSVPLKARVIAQTPAALQYFQSAGYESVLIPPGVDLDRFHPAPRRSDSSPTVLFASMPPQITGLSLRGVPLLLKAWQEIESADREVRLVVLNRCEKADGWLRAAIREKGLTRVEVRSGHVEDIEKTFRTADVVLNLPQPGSVPDAPLSVIEALACGTPVVSTRAHGLSGFVAESEGLLTVEQDPYSVARAVLGTLAKSNLADLRKATREVAERCFDVRDMVASYMKVYSS